MDRNLAIIRIKDFINKDKFIEDISIFYPGLSKTELKLPLTNLINLSAEEFIKGIRDNNTEKMLQDIIKIGLDRIEYCKYSLDSEDKDRICMYFEELMDLVELNNSGGYLNKWRYDDDVDF